MAAGDKIFLDTDVVLDHLADRQPFSEYAHRLFALAEQDEITLCISALSFSNLYYMLRKLKNGDEALSLLRKLKGLVKVTLVGEAEVKSALGQNFKDFEDALQCFSAKTEKDMIVIITRNKFDFPKNLIRVESPEEFLAKRKDDTR
jgi:predicted nucleic acid-binding protein